MQNNPNVRSHATLYAPIFYELSHLQKIQEEIYF